jgi:galactosylceramidase
MEDQTNVIKITCSEAKPGRVFEGIGGITSNGMSKLLMDYPEQQRNEIMDLLFKPKYGVSLQHLKVELGSDVNTSAGTEPSHMRSREDFDITRGYGLPIAKLAKAINPALLLDALRWGTPLWIQNDEDKLAYYLNFLRGARDEYGLEFDFLGPDINEGAFSRDWTVNTLVPGLKREGFGHIKLVADDSDHGWDIADHAAADPELFEAVYAYGVHYRQDSTDTAKLSGKSLWLSEDLAPFRHSFSRGALHIGKRIIDMYVDGKMVKYELHPLLEAEYENTPFNYKGILVATWPWSGHYRIDPGLWVIAHFTQFMQPGWIYLDDACGQSETGGFVTLTDPRTKDISIVVLNNGPETFTYQFDTGNTDRKLYIWKTTEHSHFQLAATHLESEGPYQFTAEPYAIYTITTTTGQRKGDEELSISTETTFSLPYSDTFTDGRPSGNPKYLSDQGGAFEFEPNSDDGGLTLRQRVTEAQIPIDWTYRRTPEPYTLFGSLEWTNYRLSVEVQLEQQAGYIGLGGRISYTAKSNEPPEGYWLRMRHTGRYELMKGKYPLLQGDTTALDPKAWYALELAFEGKTIKAYWNGEQLFEHTNSEISSGHAALLSSYHRHAFRSLRIEPITESTPVNCIRYLNTHTALHYSGDWGRADGDWNVYARTLAKSDTAGAEVSFRFKGEAASIVGKTCADGGFFDVYLNGTYQGTVDTYRPQTGFRKSLYTVTGLDPHAETEIRLVVKGMKHPESTNTHVYLNAVEVVAGQLLT